MIGKKLYKENIDFTDYSNTAQWCNSNNATIVDKGEYYEVVELPAPPPPTREQIKRKLINSVQEYMDETARTRNYDSIASACSYGLSTIPKFRDEALACISWRDKVWTYCYEQLDLFEAGERDVPTKEQLLAELPKLVW